MATGSASDGAGVQRSSTPSLLISAVRPSTAGGAWPARAFAPFDRPAERPLRLSSSTKYVSKRGVPAANAGGSVSVNAASPPGASCNVAAALHRAALDSLRQIRTAMSPLSRTLSVVFAGMVQVRVTWDPVRTAERSLTGTGRFNEGGSGAPGMPHPVRAKAAARAAMSAERSAEGHGRAPRIPADCMALPV